MTLQGSSIYEDWKFFNFPNIVEVIEEFPSVKVDVMLILAQLPLLQSVRVYFYIFLSLLPLPLLISYLMSF